MSNEIHGHKHTKDIVNRLSKIEGHVRGIKKMVEEEQSCNDVLIQFSAVIGALNKAAIVLMDDHFNSCIMDKVEDKELEAELIKFKNSFDRFIK